MANDANLELITRVAEALGSLRERFVFVGGCATGLLMTDPAAPRVRATRDVDAIVAVVSQPDYYALADQLRERGFHNRWRMVTRRTAGQLPASSLM